MSKENKEKKEQENIDDLDDWDDEIGCWERFRDQMDSIQRSLIRFKVRIFGKKELPLGYQEEPFRIVDPPACLLNAINERREKTVNTSKPKDDDEDEKF